jgi:hypothetical protein
LNENQYIFSCCCSSSSHGSCSFVDSCVHDTTRDLVTDSWIDHRQREKEGRKVSFIVDETVVSTGCWGRLWRKLLRMRGERRRHLFSLSLLWRRSSSFCRTSSQPRTAATVLLRILGI